MATQEERDRVAAALHAANIKTGHFRPFNKEDADEHLAYVLSSIVGRKIDDRLLTELKSELERRGFNEIQISTVPDIGRITVSGVALLGAYPFTATLG